MPGDSSCWFWNGGTLKTLAISPDPLSRATVASGGDMPMVIGSSVAKLARPHALAAEQNDGLDRHLDGRQRNLVLISKIGNGPDVGIARIEQDGLRGEGGDTLDGVGRALRARPD